MRRAPVGTVAPVSAVSAISAVSAVLVLAVASCVVAPSDVPPPPPPLPAALDAQALAEETAGDAANATLALPRVASVISVFFEEVDDLRTGDDLVAAAGAYAAHATTAVADCGDATVAHAEGSRDVLVDFGASGCLLTTTGALLEGSLLVSALDGVPMISSDGAAVRVDRIALTRVVVDGVPLAGSLDVGVLPIPGLVIDTAVVAAIGIITADQAPFGVVMFPKFANDRINLDSSVMFPVLDVFSPAPQPVAIDESGCTFASRFFAPGSGRFEIDERTCDVAGPIGATLRDTRIFQCRDDAADTGFSERRVTVEVPLDVVGAATARLFVDEVERDTLAVEVPALPVPARCE